MNVTVNQKEFWDFIHDQLDINSYEYRFLRLKLNRVESKQSVLYSESVINFNQTGWVFILLSDSIMVFGNNWNAKQIKKALSNIDLTRFANYLIEGNHQLIKELLDYARISNRKVEKERLFYKLSGLPKVNCSDEKIGLPEPNDIESIATQLQQYYDEEYNGMNPKSLDEMVKMVGQYIKSESLFVLKNSNAEILSFCTILDTDIGILYTDRAHRKNGHGSNLLSFCTRRLLKENKAVHLMTDKNVLASNNTIVKVGFKPYFEYTYLRINNN